MATIASSLLRATSRALLTIGECALAAHEFCDSWVDELRRSEAEPSSFPKEWRARAAAWQERDHDDMPEATWFWDTARGSDDTVGVRCRKEGDRIYLEECAVMAARDRDVPSTKRSQR